MKQIADHFTHSKNPLWYDGGFHPADDGFGNLHHLGWMAHFSRWYHYQSADH
jgi:hypothetical protein